MPDQADLADVKVAVRESGRAGDVKVNIGTRKLGGGLTSAIKRRPASSKAPLRDSFFGSVFSNATEERAFLIERERSLEPHELIHAGAWLSVFAAIFIALLITGIGSSSRVVRAACGLAALVVGAVTVALARRGVSATQWWQSTVGFLLGGVVLAFASSFANDDVGSGATNAAPLVVYVVIVGSLSAAPLPTTTLWLSVATLTTFAAVSSAYKPASESGWRIAREVVTLAAACVAACSAAREWAHEQREVFHRWYSLQAEHQRAQVELRSLREEKRNLMADAYTQMLGDFDLAPVDDEPRMMGSEAEELMNLLHSLDDAKLDAMSSGVVKELNRILSGSGGDIFKPTGDAIARFDSNEWIGSELNRDTSPWCLRSDLMERTSSGDTHRSSFEGISQAMDSAEDDALNELYRSINNFEFDIFDTLGPTRGRPLVFTVMALFGKHRLVSKFNIDLGKLRAFAAAIEDGYVATNPYHNAIHGADVARTCHYVLHESGLVDRMSDLEIMGAIVACAIHDFQHPGFTNNFLVETEGELAIRYNDRSVLEMHHIAATYRYLSQPEYDIFENLTPQQRKDIRKIIITMVLATDLSKHKENLDKFALNRDKVKSWIAAPAQKPSNEVKQLRSLADPEMLTLKMVMKMCDLGHAMKPLRQHIKWSLKISEEFFREGNALHDKGLRVIPLFDRCTNTNLGKSQSGFIRFLVKPLMTSFVPLVRLDDPILTTIDSNLAFWVREDEAKRAWDTREDELKALRSKVKGLGEAKAKAIAAEDYDEAKLLKQQEDQIRAKVEAVEAKHCDPEAKELREAKEAEAKEERASAEAKAKHVAAERRETIAKGGPTSGVATNTENNDPSGPPK